MRNAATTVAVVGMDGRFSPPLPHQAEVLNTWPKIDIYRWGRGGAKTATMVEKALVAAARWKGITISYIVPVNAILQQAVYPKLRAWQSANIREHEYDPIARWPENRNYLRFRWGSELHFHTATNINHFRGGDNGLIIIDEGGYIEGGQEAMAAILPSLRGIGPGCLVVGGTPDGSEGILGSLCSLLGWEPDSQLDRLETTVRVGDQDISGRITRHATVDNIYYPRASIELARMTMTPERFAQEMEAVSAKPTGLVFPEFDPTIHVAKKPLAEMLAEHNDWQVFAIIDWGYSKAHITWIVMRQGPADPSPTIGVYREMPVSHMGHEDICRMIGERINTDPRVPRAIIVDPEGAGNQVQKYAENRYARTYFGTFNIPVIWERDKAKRGIVSTLDYVRRLLKTADGKPRLWIAKEVAEQDFSRDGGRGTIASLKGYRLQEIGTSGEYKDKPKDDNKTTHAVDNLRMACINATKFGFRWMAGIPENVASIRRKWGKK
jgi:hypothetical protein